MIPVSGQHSRVAVSKKGIFFPYMKGREDKNFKVIVSLETKEPKIGKYLLSSLNHFIF